MLGILTVFGAQVPTPKRVVTLLTPTHLSLEKDNSFVVSQSLWMSEVTRGMCLDIPTRGMFRGDGLLQKVENVVRNEECRSRLLESSDIVHNKHIGKVS